ncbi:THAP domain-containing protein 1-like, partial [Aphis craccivora]
IPTIFPNLPSYLSTAPANKRKSPQKKPDNFICTKRPKLHLLAIDSTKATGNTQVQYSETSRLNFKLLLDHRDKIHKPDNKWTCGLLPNHIYYVRWELGSEKKITIDENLKIQYFKSTGYLARKANRFTKCKKCLSSLRNNCLSSSRDKLLDMRSKGNLIHSSNNLFSLISILEKSTLEALKNEEFNMNTLLTITEMIEQGDSIQLVGCVDHKEEFSKAIVRFFLIMRMCFIVKRANFCNYSKKMTKQLIPKGSGVVKRLIDKIFNRTEMAQKYKPVIQSYVKQRLLIRMKYFNLHAASLAKK